MPDFEHDPFAIRAPLMIPKSQFVNVLAGQVLRSHCVLPHRLRPPMSKSIELNGEPCQRAVEIQGIASGRMLATKLETGKSACAQGVPHLFFLVRLFAAQTPGIRIGSHNWRLTERTDRNQLPSP